MILIDLGNRVLLDVFYFIVLRLGYVDGYRGLE